ncbi:MULTISPECIES: sulfite exporter TauE/SafE family protein [unclassified Chelatococcus]|uniref:sulfite exporter TauE/SafE family protein n=1 Tax=unclassified Chelatococcus TaxID=2638111 RepID=UPI001BCE77EA|nr:MULTISPECIES: sulfite exporter TauE/SafE family protein [unclassified Chelatococcus]MBS7700267.1 sulfite exporter TauE/SafE family protein [Chelatococcus sp. YT9]MBX3558238.1 sulfite exporter TauE/SafE family protein [Chelatococcus sp.]
MELWDIGLLASAGLLGGLCNAIAGGGTFFIFPALLTIGLPPVSAGATSAISIWPGHAAGLIGEGRVLRDDLGRRPGRIAIFAFASAAGAGLLLVSGDALFRALVPWLLLFATILFAVGPALNRWLTRRGIRTADGPAALFEGVVALYGGFFGAGLGVMLLAVLTITEGEEIARLNVVKNGLATLATSIAILIFAASGAVAWGPAAVVFLGAVAGGMLGGRLARRVNPQILRIFVVCVGLALVFYYA